MPGASVRDEALRDVTHVFLDVGGTLLYSEPGNSDIFLRILSARGHRIDRGALVRLLRTPESIVSLIRPFPAGREAEFFRAVNARIIEHLGIDSDDPMLEAIHAEFNRGVTWKLFPEVVGVLKDLRRAGYRLGVISNADHALPDILRMHGLAEFFDTVTYSFEAGAEKPDPRIFQRAVAQANAVAERSVHVGDNFEADYLGARRARLHAILLHREGDPPEPCPSIRSLAPLPGLLGEGHSRP